MTAAILQSNYIPWKGYFDIIAKADVFIVYDEVQYTKNDWRNRNLVKTAQGLQWLTIPVKQDHLNQVISETEVATADWAKKHMQTLQTNYGSARYFSHFKEPVFAAYASAGNNLHDINLSFIRLINRLLKIETEVIDSKPLQLTGNKVERLIDACEKVGATNYLSGPAAKAYLDESHFASKGITVEWMDYSGYPPYEQLFPPFEHGVTVLDLLFNEGPNARKFLKFCL